MVNGGSTAKGNRVAAIAPDRNAPQVIQRMAYARMNGIVFTGHEEADRSPAGRE